MHNFPTLRELRATRRSRKHWLRRALKICHIILSQSKSHGPGMVVPGAWCNWGGRCGLGWITVLGRMAVFFGMYLSGTHRKLGLLYDTEVTPQVHPEETLTVSRVAYSVPLIPPGDSDKVGSGICRTFPGGAKSNFARGKRKRVDVGNYMEARQHEILRAPGTPSRPTTPPPPGAPHQGNPPGGLLSTFGDVQGIH